MDHPGVLIVGHRGSAGTAPENTLASFHHAVCAGADMIEFDVRMAGDGTLMVIHDRRVNRTTNGRGSVYGMNVDTIRQFDAGVNFHRRFRGQRVPLLREVFASVPTSIGLNIEVKTEGDPTWRTQMAPAIVNAIRTHGGSHRVLVSSFNHVFLKKLRRLDPTIALGALVMPLRDVARKPSGLARNLGVSVYVCSRTQLRQRNVVDAHAHGMSVLVYGVTTPAHAIRAARFECDGIITDFPDSMVRLFRTDSLQRQPARKQ